jgi:hypothetical protein
MANRFRGICLQFLRPIFCLQMTVYAWGLNYTLHSPVQSVPHYLLRGKDFADLEVITWKKASVGIYDIFLLLVFFTSQLFTFLFIHIQKR